MQLAGLDISRELMLELAERLTHSGASDTAALLLIADAKGEERVGLAIRDREALIHALDDRPAGLEELCGLLLREHVWRQREGLV